MRRYFVQTFGCQMNVHDSRRIEEVLRGEGYAEADEASLADLIVVNTCSVREKAEHKLMSLLGTLRPVKQINPRAVVAVAGCVAQQEGERLLTKEPVIDVIIGPDNIADLPALVRDVEQGAPPQVRTVFDMDDPRFLQATPDGGGGRREVTAYVTVMKGCDERCTFCIVPYTRGSERYRAADDIVAEIAGLVAGGVREVTLLGQTVNSWFSVSASNGDSASTSATRKSRRGPSRSEFADLLRRIVDQVPDLVRLRYTSPHPRHLNGSLIEAHADLPELPAHLHLPVQSGSDRMLRRMARRYTREEYLECTRALKARRPGVTLSTDFIVGFPGETEEDFEQTLSLVHDAGFVAAFCFKYSPRPYTPALELGDNVPEEVKDERLSRLLAQIEVQQTAHLQSLVGTEQQVLVEGRSRGAPRRFTGRSGRHEIVHLTAPAGVDPTGELVTVTIDEAYRHSLSGLMHGAATESATAPRAKRRLPLTKDA